MKATAALTCSSVSAGLPPLGGITPVWPVKPWMAWVSRVSMPCARRGPQAAWSPTFGAPATPAVWQLWQSWS